MDFLKKHFISIIIAFSMLSALIFYSLNIPDNRDAGAVEKFALTLFEPVLKPVFQLSLSLKESWDGYMDLIGTHEENQRLKAEIRKLNERLTAANEALQENVNLKRLLIMKETVKSPSLSASVIGEDISSWFKTIIIDAGSLSGIKDGMAVIAADGVVGQTIKVSGSVSRVLLLTDRSSGISATIQRSRARGVVKGKGNGECSLEFASREEDVKVGDIVVSSGIGGVFPKGIPIGEVTMVKHGEYGIFQTVTIRPAVNLEHLEEVLVLVRDIHE